MPVVLKKVARQYQVACAECEALKNFDTCTSKDTP
jgi:hypothetical protein